MGYAIALSFIDVGCVLPLNRKERTVSCLCVITKDCVFVCLFVIFLCYMKPFQLMLQPFLDVRANNSPNISLQWQPQSDKPHCGFLTQIWL